MKFQPPAPALDEARLVKIYQELTGAMESQARSVFILVCCKGNNENGELSGRGKFVRPTLESPDAERELFSKVRRDWNWSPARPAFQA